jgi:fructokinase
LENNKMFFVQSIPVAVVDTIGSGDAFLAGFLASKLKGASVDKCLQNAATLAAFITANKGAIHAHSGVVQLDLD